MKENIVKTKSFEFAVKIVKLYQFLTNSKKEYILSKQLLRSGTAIGALIRESEHAESRADFIHKLAVALKEATETAYWLDLIHYGGYLSDKIVKSYNSLIDELIRLLVSILKTIKKKTN